MATGTLAKPVVNITEMGISIPTGSDLNSYITPGRYYASSAAGITNTPEGVSTYSNTAFDLIVMQRATASRVWQIMFVYKASTSPEMWFRVQNGATTFSSWIKAA